LSVAARGAQVRAQAPPEVEARRAARLFSKTRFRWK
jgi:hypothetical protein